MSERYKPMMFRLSKKEESMLEKKCIDINKMLVNNDCAPVQKSELLHSVLTDIIKRIKLNNRNEIEVD